MPAFIAILIASIALLQMGPHTHAATPPIPSEPTRSAATSSQSLLGLTLTLPPNWTFQSLAPTVVGLYSPDPMTTATITLYTFPQWPNATQVRKKRESTLYDGWIVRQSRLGTPSENRAAQADSREVVVYAQQRLSSDNKVVSNLIIEHYMTKGLRGYAISIRTTDSQWTRMEQTIKSFIRSIIL